ncbi:helix-turn-helix domain-containing protein [Desulfofundulus sp. TPOSR]|uniref:IS66 family insertion sequence element accessory protein TnpA n=1 Tax=Desulfofundulus sp. TPOSR TaxID=2714340 RepID=UPI00140A9B96|nr:helix-turn-helix domain-containing protein [Desulfofundulus sp. TPOSR]NHM26002.1 helix-turn-helix domain-containing protein [Desulfofundulus sp. TPOSR]NHM28126.1 helix-turn-helix domain-containing protein [Desulfofundulus sp. TPOSR]
MTKAEKQKLWETRVAEYRASGQSAKAWCAAHNVTPRQLWYWLRKFKESSPAGSTRWLPVELSKQSPSDQGDSLLLKIGQACIEVKPGFDPALLSQVVRVLVSLC